MEFSGCATPNPTLIICGKTIFPNFDVIPWPSSGCNRIQGGDDGQGNWVNTSANFKLHNVNQNLQQNIVIASIISHKMSVMLRPLIVPHAVLSKFWVRV